MHSFLISAQGGGETGRFGTDKRQAMNVQSNIEARSCNIVALGKQQLLNIRAYVASGIEHAMRLRNTTKGC